MFLEQQPQKYPLLESCGARGNIQYLTRFFGLTADEAKRYIQENQHRINQREPQRPKRPTDAAVVQEYDRTKNVQQTAKNLGCSLNVARAALRRANHTPRDLKRRKREEIKRQAIELRLRGVGTQTIADQLGCSQSLIVYVLREASKDG